ncbi:integral membrane protein, partial [Colletotrichum incanum]
MDIDIDPSRPRQILAIAIFFLVLTWIAVPLRVYSKIALKREFVFDDKLLCLVQAIFTTYLTMSIMGVAHGQGRDATEISPEDRRIALQYFFSAELLYIITTILLKVCVGILLLRIAIVPTHIWILRIILFVTVLFGVGYLFLVGFQCRPISKFWDQSPRSPGHCFKTSIVLGTTFTAAILNCIADCTFGLLPLFIVWSLHMRRKTKALVSILLSFASIASIATVIRAITIPSILSEGNFLRDTTYLAIWSAIEPGIGISAACAPALCPIARQLNNRCYDTVIEDFVEANRAPGKNNLEGRSPAASWKLYLRTPKLSAMVEDLAFSVSTLGILGAYAKARSSACVKFVHRLHMYYIAGLEQWPGTRIYTSKD